MWLLTFWTRCRTWWRDRRGLHKALVWAVMLSFLILPLLWLVPNMVTACVSNFILWFALMVIGTVPRDTFS